MAKRSKESSPLHQTIHKFGVQKRVAKPFLLKSTCGGSGRDSAVSREHGHRSVTEAGQRPSLRLVHHSCFRDSDLSKGSRAQL